jgi:hypothetical protein
VLYSDNLHAWQQCDRKAAQEQASRRAAVSQPLASTAAQTPITAPVWKVGSEWAYRYETPGSVGTFVWSLDRIEALEGQSHYVIKAGTREIFYRVGDFAFTQETVDGKIIRQNTPAEWRFVAFPLAPGKSWDMTYHEVRPEARQSADVRRSCTAEAEETVTVPAGTFSTIRVSCKNSRNGAWALTAWFSPQVAHFAREESPVAGGKRARELISCRLR